jgi:ribokinase
MEPSSLPAEPGVQVNGRVIVVGSVNVDLVAHAAKLPVPGETVTGGTFSQHDGGKGANQAVAAARLGATTAFVGMVGRDVFGMRARGALEHEGIDLAGLHVSDGATGVALILVDDQGENVIVVASGVNGMLSPTDVADALERLAPTAGDVVLVGHEIPSGASSTALRFGRLAGATTILNPAPATGVDRSMFGLADILTGNRLEIAAIAAADARRGGRARDDGLLAAARRLLEPSPEGEGVARAVVVTLGSAGAVVVPRDGQPVDFPARGVDAVDAVGAGDTFAGAVAASLAAGQDIEGATRRAVAAATISTRRTGAREGMPTADELAAFLEG